MSQIISQTENSPLDDYHHSERAEHAVDKEFVLSHSLIHYGIHSRVNAIITNDLKTAKDLSHFRPGFEIIFVTKNEHEAHEACLLWGVVSLIAKSEAVTAAKNQGLLKHGQRYINATKTRKEAAIELVH